MKESEFSDQLGKLFIRYVYCEGIMKKLLIFKKNPEWIEIFNSGGDLPKKFLEIYISYIKGSFSRVVEEFFKEFKFHNHEHNKKLIEGILHQRDLIGHGMIYLNNDRLYFIPREDKRGDVIKETMNIPDNGNVFFIPGELLKEKFDEKMMFLEKIENEVFKDIALKLGLNYEMIR